ncbi:hypothetical protein WDZ11_00165 (plasmid) [Roseomonas mucosa]|uniref:hypothetical protein n=1 Tax=Roseomonas mucosa TaxID=207340 RepID=UPI0030D0C3DE
MPAERSTEKSMVLSAQALADALAVDRKTVTNVWVPAGCPPALTPDDMRPGIGAPKMWQFNLAEVVRWLRAEDARRVAGTSTDENPDYGHERAREKRYAADLKRIARDRLAGRLIEIQQVTEVVVDEYAKVRARMLSMPSALAMRVQHETDLPALERIIKAAVSEALAELAADTRADWAEAAAATAAADPDAVAAAAEDDDEEKAA